MTTPVTFASSFRRKAALCCSAAFLLTACGGATDDLDSHEPQPAMTAGEIIEAPGTVSTAAVDGARHAAASLALESATPAAAALAADSAAAPVAPAIEPAPSHKAPTGAEAAAATAGDGVPTNEFSLSGYQDASAAAPSDVATQGAAATSSADGQ